MNHQRAIFIDRDGCINEDVGYLSRPEDLVIYPWSGEAIRLVNNAGLKAIVITNQSGVARGHYTEETLAGIHDRLREELASEGAHIDAIYYCPHHPNIGDERYRQACICRKPRPGMLHKAAREHDIDLESSYVIGDKASDINLAANAGAKGVLVLTGYGQETYEDRERRPCEPEFVADTLLDAVKQILTPRINADKRG
ncbi:MAG TPA: HAD family hydrolase [Blastocatellia bacterium]|nr:HAD family hydrolase [Blastocatellia bacterium]